MFRITSSVINARRLLYRRVRLEIQAAAITRFSPNCAKYAKPQERDPCPVPPPVPSPPPKDDTMLWVGMTLLSLAGGFAVYAKTNPELRDWLTINAPWMDDIIAVLYQENMTYKEFATQCIEDTKKAVGDFFSDDKPKQCTSDGKPLQPVEPPPVEFKECTEDTEGDYVVVKFCDVNSVTEDLEPCERLPPPILTKDICEIERCLKDLGDTAIINYMCARDACIYFNKLVEETMLNFSFRGMYELQSAMEERVKIVKESMENAICAVAKLDELTRYFECGVQASKEAIKNTKDLLKEYKTKIAAVRMQYQWENDKAVAMDAHWLQVKEIVDKYTEETKTMSKNLDYMIDKPVLLGDPDLLLHHTKRYVELLREQLSDAILSMTDRVNRGLETLPQGEKDVKDRASQIQSLYKKKLAELDADYVKRFKRKKADNDRCLKDELKRTVEQSQETLILRLEQKEIEANKKLDKLVAEKVAEEKRTMAREISKMARQLKLLEDKLNARLKAEREARRSQELWSAGASLLAATKKGDPYVRVDKELRAIEKASGDGDKLVATVLKAIPDSVREKGVVPESVIRAKYHVMENVALKVALVEEEGAPLPVYFLSYLQSIFLFMKINGIPQKEFEKPPKEPPTDLDTFDLLQRARFWIERGNIAAALNYVTALEGASRAAAASWHDAARSHLETRQAAEAVLAHAAALGLQYI